MYIVLLFSVQSKNLGVLTSLRVGHDNSGITPSLFVEMVLVHNLTTGQTYRYGGEGEAPTSLLPNQAISQV